MYSDLEPPTQDQSEDPATWLALDLLWGQRPATGQDIPLPVNGFSIDFRLRQAPLTEADCLIQLPPGITFENAIWCGL